jgi:hypothetical protein
MTAEQPGKIGLWRELQLLWPILLRWREYRVGDYMRAVQELHLETFDSFGAAARALRGREQARSRWREDRTWLR